MKMPSRLRMPLRFLAFTLPLVVFFQNFNVPEPSNICSEAKRSEVVAQATAAKSSVVLQCSLQLSKGERMTKRILIQGHRASGIVLDCRGAILDAGEFNQAKDLIEVASIKSVNPQTQAVSWSRPENVQIKNCVLQGGAVRVYGLGKNGEATDVHNSSLSPGHTQRTQNSAPRNILFQRMNITSGTRTPFYIGPGSTFVTLKDSVVSGPSDAVALYMDAESARNTIKNNRIHRKDVDAGKRELFAVDGSAYNLIAGNRFSALNNGGIFLYRNCGEGGTVRHQAPVNNHIINNIFYYNKYDGGRPSVWLASRNGNKGYCGDDNGINFGSSEDNRDLARNNVVAQNQIYKLSPYQMIRASEQPNTILQNETVTADIVRRSACFVENAYPSELLFHGQSTTRTLVAGAPRCTGLQKTCVDGELTSAAFRCPVAQPKPQVVRFTCKASSNNAGCMQVVQCPAGKHIIAVRGVCDLETGSLPAGIVGVIPWNILAVHRASDHSREGSCRINSFDIPQGRRGIASLRGESSINYSCREHDKNGGDCRISVRSCASNRRARCRRPLTS